MPTEPAAPTAEQLPVRTAAVWAALDPLVSAGTALRVLDVGGGSGMFAVPLARLGHRVTVVDPSADALATLHRRAQTAGVANDLRKIGRNSRIAGLVRVEEPAIGRAGGPGLDLARHASGDLVQIGAALA